MRLHYLQHVPYEGLGIIENWAVEQGAQITSTQLYLNHDFPPVEEIDLLVIMGGPMGVYDEADYPWLSLEKRFIKAALEQPSIRMLGICLGAQLIAECLGAAVSKNAEREIGWFPVFSTSAAVQTGLTGCFPEKIEVFHWHSDTFSLPEGALQLARSEACENQAFILKDRVLGLQFHPEMTSQGIKDLILEFGTGLKEGAFVQSAAEMKQDLGLVQAGNQMMLNILEAFISKPA